MCQNEKLVVRKIACVCVGSHPPKTNCKLRHLGLDHACSSSSFRATAPSFPAVVCADRLYMQTTKEPRTKQGTSCGLGQ